MGNDIIKDVGFFIPLHGIQNPTYWFKYSANKKRESDDSRFVYIKHVTS